MKVALAGDVALELIAPYFREAGFDVYVPPGFGAWRREILDPGSGLSRFSPDFVFDVTSRDAELAEETPGFFDDRMRRLASMPYSLAGIRAIVDEFRWFAAASPKKVLAVDADNTLWDGILSEDGADALVPRTGFQNGLLALRAKGVVLVLLTKNDPPSPGTDFIRGDMAVKDRDFAAAAVNWSPKAGNLVEICRKLNLDESSVVFVDDNPHERAQMAAHLPQVSVAPWSGWSADPSGREVEARQLLRRLETYFFAGAGTTREDALRAADYASPARALKAEFRDAGEYLESLGLWVEPRLAAAGDVPRLAQMAGKTNQFNATTLRRSEADFAALLADPSKRVFVFRAGDRFGEQGVVCYVVADFAARRVTDFVMSCRAMGRTLERFAFRYVVDTLGFVPAVDFVPTAKNAPFKEFLDSGPEGMSGKTYYERLDRQSL
jgi:FkbH-like protein